MLFFKLGSGAPRSRLVKIYRMRSNLKISLSLSTIFTLVLLCGQSASATTVTNESSSVKIQNNATSWSNTGGNTGHSSISTGDAKSSNEIRVKVPSSSSTYEVDTHIKSEANDQTAKIDSQDTSPTSTKEESKDENASVQASLEISETKISETPKNETTQGDADARQGEKPLMQRVSDILDSLAKSIGSLFSM